MRNYLSNLVFAFFMLACGQHTQAQWHFVHSDPEMHGAAFIDSEYWAWLRHQTFGNPLHPDHETCVISTSDGGTTWMSVDCSTYPLYFDHRKIIALRPDGYMVDFLPPLFQYQVRYIGKDSTDSEIGCWDTGQLFGFYPISRDMIVGIADQGFFIGNADTVIYADTTILASGSNLYTNFLFADTMVGYAFPATLSSETYYAVLRTSDGGLNWDTCLVPPVPMLSSQLMDNGTLILSGYAGSVMKSSDGGTVWTDIPTPYDGNVTSALFLTDSLGYIAMDVGLSYMTVDGGLTWEPDTICADCRNSKLTFGAPDVVWAYTTHHNQLTGEDEPRVYKRYLGPTGIPDRLALTVVSVFPNPNSGYFRVSVRSATQTSIKFKLLDQFGRVLQQEYMPFGETDLDMEISNLSDGVYTLFIDDGKDSLYQRVVKSAE